MTDAAAPLRRLLDELDEGALGAELHGLVRDLYPICRSITGDGVRRTLERLSALAPLVLHEVPSGTTVFDWVVPREWNVRAARLTDPAGRVVADVERHSLHLMSYSVPFRGRVPLEELQKHLHSLPEKPGLIPYRTSYYAENWGFCLSHDERQRLPPGDYDVLVDTTLADGSLTYGEVVIAGAQPDVVLVSAHCCHPSLANDNLSGLVLAAALARIMGSLRPRYTYRFLFVPGTIGTIAWLALHEAEARRIAHGLVAACVGDGGRLTYKRSRRGDAEIDRAAAHVLAHAGQEHAIRDFTPYGYDERQYGSPGFDLPVGSLTRTPHGEYPEYHTSADDPDLVRPDALIDSIRRYLEIFEVLEGNHAYVNLAPMCEPQLGKRGLYGKVGGLSHPGDLQMAMLWVLNLSDGRHTLLDVAERSRTAFPLVRAAADALQGAGLLRRVESAPAGETLREGER
jgi:aminopeptidase-like protein